MRPKSPFLQNLRKKTPPPRMSKQTMDMDKRAGEFGVKPAEPRPFEPFQFGGSEIREFLPWSVEKPQEEEPEELKAPPIDIAKEKRIAHDMGYQKAKAEYEQYKIEAEKLEKAFQEIAHSMEEARHIWVREVREQIAEGFRISLHHIIKNDDLKQSELAHQLAEAMATLSEEKEMRVSVSPDFVDFARGYLVDKPRWIVQSSEELTGGAIFESENGIWDARLQVVLDEIDHQIKSWLIEKSGE